MRLVQLQYLVASLGRLECPICAEGITLADDVRRCMSRFHCFHASCLRSIGTRRKGACPECGCRLAPGEETMIDSLTECEKAIQKCRPKNATDAASRVATTV